jgi:hypothetical protein
MRRYLILALFGGFGVVFSFPALGAATPSTPTIMLNTTNLTVTEGNSITIDFTVTNNTDSSYTLGNFAGGALFFLGPGDSSDTFSNTSIGPIDNCRFHPLANGASCEYQETGTTPQDTAETDGDSGVNSTCIAIIGQSCDQSDLANGTAIQFNVTVQDASAVPEPSTLMLLGTALGCVGLGRMRFRRAPRDG